MPGSPSTAAELVLLDQVSVLSSAPVTSHARSDSHSPQSSKLGPHPWSKLETFLLLAIVAYSLVFAHFCAHGRIFWEDEMLGSVLLKDPSFSHMIAGWRHGDDGGGLAFYLTGRAWFLIFGSSVGSFRAYSQMCFSLAMVFCWLSMRRFYRPLVVAASILGVWLISPEIPGHMIEGRFYGLLVASFACGTWLCLQSTSRKITPLLYLATFCAHLLLTSSHVLGIVYSAALLTTTILLDRTDGRWRPKLYGTIVTSWLILIPSLQAIRASAAVGNPHFWTTEPTLLFFLIDYTGYSKHLLTLFTVGAVLLGWKLRSREGRELLRLAYKERTPAFVFMGICFSIPALFYIEGLFGPPLCISRYLLPVLVATTFAGAELLTMLRAAYLKFAPERPMIVAAASIALFSMVVLYDLVYVAPKVPLHKDYRPALAGQMPQDAPLVCEDAFAFTEFVGPSAPPNLNCVFLLDWSNSVSPKAPLVEVTQYHLMQNWKESGYYSDLILPSQHFIQETPHFYTVSFSEVMPRVFAAPVVVDRLTLIGSDLHTRLSRDSRYHVTLYKSLSLGEVKAFIWEIREVG